jgi:tetraacyldisaccharide 4'-kinase
MTIFEFFYFLGYSLKKRHALNRQKRLPRKVISVGNITLGGTGKTPAAIALAKEAKKRGLMPCILTRGYKGIAEGPCFVSKGEGLLLDEYHAGDEAVLMAEKLEDVPVVKGKNRYEAGMFALSSLPAPFIPDLFVLDDGFQHWHLFRDKDVLLVDGINPFGNGRLLPVGSLREPVNATARADVIVITKIGKNGSQGRKEMKGTGEKGLVEELRKYNTYAPIFPADHRPSMFAAASGAGDTFPLEWAKDRKIFGFCGIGNPGSFKATLLCAGADLKGFIGFRDHYRYTKRDIGAIIKNAAGCGAGWIVTTEKDIMRLRGMDLPENLVTLVIDFVPDGEFYDKVLNFEI